MHAFPVFDPLAWLLASYLLGSLVCGAWAVSVRIVRTAVRGAS